MKKADILSRRPDLRKGVENDNKGIQLLPQFENHEIQSRVTAGIVQGTLRVVFIKEI